MKVYWIVCIVLIRNTVQAVDYCSSVESPKTNMDCALFITKESKCCFNSTSLQCIVIPLNSTDSYNDLDCTYNYHNQFINTQPSNSALTNDYCTITITPLRNNSNIVTPIEINLLQRSTSNDFTVNNMHVHCLTTNHIHSFPVLVYLLLLFI